MVPERGSITPGVFALKIFLCSTSIAAGTSLDMKSATKMSIKSETTIDMDATTEVDIDSSLINLN